MRIKRILRSAAACLMALMLAVASLPALAVGGSTTIAERGDKYIVNVSELNVRKGPGTEYAVLGTVKKGAVLTFVSNSGGWWKVYASNGKGGYVDKQFLSPQSTQSSGNYFVTANELRIRKAPSTSAGVLGTVEKGTLVTINRINGDWGYLSAGAGTKGWVALKYVSKVNTSASVSNNTVSAKEAYVVRADKLNVRASGSAKATRIDTLERGETVAIARVDGGWAQVVYKDNGRLRNGWVSMSYLAKK
ncbi:MAG: SH3 domain-containing protein [Eubacteriales bacterium]|nr:SH3 domain-containing protein [Eubacteriales bacterium]